MTAGVLQNPVGIYSRFSDCKSLVKRGVDLGDSVCIGLPSRGDVIAVLNAADIPLPAGRDVGGRGRPALGSSRRLGGWEGL